MCVRLHKNQCARVVDACVCTVFLKEKKYRCGGCTRLNIINDFLINVIDYLYGKDHQTTNFPFQMYRFQLSYCLTIVL